MASPLACEASHPDNVRAAWERVLGNRGCAGADGVTLGAFAKDLQENLYAVCDALASGWFQPFPLLKLPVPKKAGGFRYLAVPTVFDRTVGAALAGVLGSCLDATFEDTSFAYRPRRSWQDALRRVRDLRDRGYAWVFDADIRGFFDHVDHDLLLEAVARAVPDAGALRLLERFVRVEIYDGSSVRPLARGIPQGSPLSPLLANLFLDPFDEALQAEGVPHVRYADDFVVFFRDQEGADRGRALVEEALRRLRLRLHPEKSRITSFRQGFRFLGAFCSADAVMVPLAGPRPPRDPVRRPPALTLEAYRRLRDPRPLFPED